ncbi:hypothetical protein H072_5652 [Dactylellina haptotyla CBS 200.50]|uniref:Mid2 domain-containing protein n=1 Tax=Dactylellina haptotyla (strain CBS 200.50) TaxID=1284197 RepID=S8BM35_DACHA|nr:hypothetical protein H072_5652 [Dactylellina haptotyla CBS 200.50]
MRWQPRVTNWFVDDAPITLCQDGTRCCDQGQGVQLPTNFVQGGATVTSFISHVSSSSSSSTVTTEAMSTTSTTTATTIVPSIRSSKTSLNPPAGTSTDPTTENKTSGLPSSSPPSSPPSQSSSPGIPNTAKIAIGAGVAVVAVIAAALAYIFRHKFKKHGPPVYEKNAKGPFEIATSQTAFGRRSFHAVTKPPSQRQNHVNVHELY